ncbi:MAG: CehA/McbA family metallohydrolase [bacterium]
MTISLKLDLHIHSEASSDGLTSVDRILRTAERRELDGFSITDHNYFDPDRHRRLQEKTDRLIIPGEEVSTDQGHVLAYFIESEIEGFRDASSVIQDIHDQNGLAVMAHPFRLRQNYPDDYFNQFDGVELFNARSGDPSRKETPNFYTKQVLEHAGITSVTGGSDSHVYWTIGNGITEVTARPSEDSLKKAIRSGKTDVYGTPSYEFNRAISRAVYLSNNPDFGDWMNYFPQAARWVGRDCSSLLGFG